MALACTAAAAILTGCGGEGEPRDPDALLDAAFQRPVSSAATSVDLGLKLEGSERLSEPLKLSADGP